LAQTNLLPSFFACDEAADHTFRIARDPGELVDRRIDGWAERILLWPTSFDAALLQGIPDEPIPVTDEVTIELKRRA
jgi:hypothetical protein